MNIDEKIIEQMKKNIDNISEFAENCFKYYLGIENNMHNVLKDNEILEQIGILQTKLYLNKEKNKIEKNLEKQEKFEKDKAWRQLWTDYRRTRLINKELSNKASETLNISVDELEMIMDELVIESIQCDTNSWSAVYTEYNKINEGD